MTSSVPGDGGVYRRQTLKLTDLTLVSDLLEGLRFEECMIIGPAIIVPISGTTIANCQFDGPGPEAVFWPIDDDRSMIVGAIGARDVEFYGCRFQRIGIGVPRSQMDQYVQGFSRPD